MTDTNLGELLRQLDAISGDEISLGDVVAQLEDRGYGPMLLGPGLIAMLPSGAIPGVPTACGLLIALIAVQLLLGRRHPWLPKPLRELSFSRQRFASGIERVTPIADYIDRFIHPRLVFLTAWPFTRIVAGVCVLLGLGMIPLELIPFAVLGPAAVIVFASLALSARDGLMLIFGALILVVSAVVLLAGL